MDKFRCVLADPPWKFNDRGSRIAPDYSRHYDVMDLSEIIGLAPMIKKLVDKNAHLWLWAPSTFVISGDAQLVAKMWGFPPKQIATWCKNKIGMGHWMRNTTEQLLLCVKGRLGPLAKNVPTHFTGKIERHSKKPPESYELIEAISPGPRLELFARYSREGWYSWGDEAPEENCIGD